MKSFDIENKKIASGFKIPEAYFDDFENKMLGKVFPENEAKVVSLFYKKHIWISAIAAVFVALFSIPLLFNGNSTSKIETLTIENYLTTEYSTYDILNNMTIEEVTSIDSDLSINDEELESYLINTQNLDYYLNQ